MRTRLPFSVFFLTGFVCLHFLSFAQDIHFNLVSRAQDDVVGLITGMAQDKQGFLWITTFNGLYKYDGYQYSSYHTEPLNPNSLAPGRLECVTIDKTGCLWLAPRGSGLDRFDPSTGIFTHFRHNDNEPGSLADDLVLATLQDHEGILWIGTKNGLDKFDSTTNTFFHYKHDTNDPSSLSCDRIRAIYEDKQGTIWVGTGDLFNKAGSEGGLNKFNRKSGKFTRYMHDEKDPHSLIDNGVRAIFEDSRNNFWIGTAGDGLHTMDRTKGTFERHLYDPSHPDKLSRPPMGYSKAYDSTDFITFIIEDNKGRIWIGTFQGGINVYDPATQKVSHYGTDKNSKEKLENKGFWGDNGFWTAYKTTDNIIWISSWGSNLYKIQPYQSILPHTQIGKVVLCFAEDDAQTLWLGTLNGLIHKENNGKEEQFLIDKDSSGLNQISSIEKDGNKFWITTGHGLYLFDPSTKTFSSYHHQAGNANSLLSDMVYSVKKGTDNMLWIGTYNSLDMMDTKRGTFRHFQYNPKDSGLLISAISNNGIWRVLVDKNRTVWGGSYNGLYRLDQPSGNFKRYLSQTPVTCILEDRAGILWVGTTTGLFKYNKANDKFSGFLDEWSIISATIQINGITEDNEQNLWLKTDKGILRLNKERKNVIAYGKNQGVNILTVTGAGYIRQNGEIVYGDTSGYFSFQPNLLQQNISGPSVTIDNFLLNNVPVQPTPNGILTVPLAQTKEIRLSHDQNTFSFGFANIDFISEHADTHLRFMLQNYDNAWRKAGDERTAYYFNLPPGKYIFKVKALNAAGVAAEKDIAVIITPPWWSTWWAYTIFVSLFVGFVWAFIAYRSARLKQENNILEEKVGDRTAQLKQSLQDLKATQAQLIQSEKMASLGELTAGIAHEIQNPLNFVNNFSDVNTELIEELKSQKSKVKNERDEELENEILNDIAENEQKINHHGKRADAIVKGMLQHSRASSGKKELTDINALANEYLRLAYQGLRAKDPSFNVTIQTDFDESIGMIAMVPQDIGRVLLNLYNNAFYAASLPPPEKIGINSGGFKDYTYKHKPTVWVTTSKILPSGGSGAVVLLSVKDNGPGIPPAIIDKIFQPFFTTKPTGQGTGLGLSLSYDIVKAHGGELKVETKEGEGSQFIIQLPSA